MLEKIPNLDKIAWLFCSRFTNNREISKTWDYYVNKIAWSIKLIKLIKNRRYKFVLVKSRLIFGHWCSAINHIDINAGLSRLFQMTGALWEPYPQILICIGVQSELPSLFRPNKMSTPLSKATLVIRYRGIFLLELQNL